MVEAWALLSGLPDAGKLGLAAQLSYWRQNGRSRAIYSAAFDIVAGSNGITTTIDRGS